MMIETVQAADKETHCQCCGRKNRKLHLIQGGWVGADCAKDVKAYRDALDCHRDPASDLRWLGYAAKFQQVKEFCQR